jgi:hypothetical protein
MSFIRRRQGALALPALVLLSFLILACSGLAPAPPPSGDYVGTWTNGGVTLIIQPTGTVNYSSEGGTTSTSYDGPVSDWSNQRMDFLIGGATIDVAPHDDGGTWKMTVDGVELTRQ